MHNTIKQRHQQLLKENNLLRLKNTMHFRILAPFLGTCSFLAPSRTLRSLDAQAAATTLLPRINDRLVIPPDVLPQTETPEPYVAHSAPKSTYLILNAPAISSFILVKGWTENSLQTLTNAVHAVVEKNPVLTGRATCADNWWKDPTIRIHLNEFQPLSGHYSFVTTIDKTQSPTLPGDQDTVHQLAYIDKHVAPMIAKTDSTLQQIQKKSPLFEVKVILLPDSHACIYTKMSHCIGDFVTYYELLDQIASLDKGQNFKPIRWDNPFKAGHEIFPQELSQRDMIRLYGPPFLAGLASHVPTMPFRKQRYLVLSTDKIQYKRHQLMEEKGCTGVTGNSIVTAALCDANRSTDIFAMTRSMRRVAPRLGLRDGGNLYCEIPFERCAGRNPLVVQDILDRGRYFEPDEIPYWPCVTGRIGRITNCVVPMHNMSFGGCQPICYCPNKSFLDHTPMDVAVIFRVAKGKDAVLHNFQHMKPSKQLQSILLDEDDE
jgi:hypothetical protein